MGVPIMYPLSCWLRNDLAESVRDASVSSSAYSRACEDSSTHPCISLRPGGSPVPNGTCAFQRIPLPRVNRLLGGGKRVDARVHQSKHSTPCCMVSIAVPENRAPFLLPSSAFPA